MLRKTPANIFITNNFTQFKTSRTLKIDVFEITDNKNIEKLFSKYELFLLDQANSSPDPSQTLILRFPIPRASHNPHYVLHCFPYFVLPHSSKRHYKYWIYQTIWQAKPIKFIIKLFTNHHTLWIRHATHQKAKSLRAAFFWSQTTRSTTTLFSIQSMLSSLRNGRCTFIFTTLLVHTTTTTISIKKPFLYFKQLLLHLSTLTF